MDPEKAPDKPKHRRPKSYAEAFKVPPSMEPAAPTPTSRRRATSDSSASPKKSSMTSPSPAATQAKPVAPPSEQSASEPVASPIAAPEPAAPAAPAASPVPEWPSLKSPGAVSLKSPGAASSTSTTLVKETSMSEPHVSLKLKHGGLSPKPSLATSKPVMSYAAMTRKNIPPPKKQPPKDAWAADEATEQAWEEADQQLAIRRATEAASKLADKPASGTYDKSKATLVTEAGNKQTSRKTPGADNFQRAVTTTPTVPEKRVSSAPELLRAIESVVRPAKPSPKKATESPQKSTAPLGAARAAELLGQKRQSPEKAWFKATPTEAEQPVKDKTMKASKLPQKKGPLTWASVVKGDKAAAEKTPVVPRVAPRIEPATPLIPPATPRRKPGSPKAKSSKGTAAPKGDGDVSPKKKTPAAAKKDRRPRAKKDENKKPEDNKLSTPWRQQPTGNRQDPPASTQSRTWGRNPRTPRRSGWQQPTSSQWGRQRASSTHSGPGTASGVPASTNLSWSDVADGSNTNSRPNLYDRYADWRVTIVPFGNLATTLRRQQDEELVRMEQEAYLVRQQAAATAQQQVAEAAVAASRREGYKQPAQAQTPEPSSSSSALHLSPRHQPRGSYTNQARRLSNLQNQQHPRSYYQSEAYHQQGYYQPQRSEHYQQQAGYYMPAEHYQQPGYYPGHQYNQTTYYHQPAMQYHPPGYQPQPEHYQPAGYYQQPEHIPQQGYHPPPGPVYGPFIDTTPGAWYPDPAPIQPAQPVSMDIIRNVPPRPDEMRSSNSRGRSPTVRPIQQAREASAYAGQVKRERERSAMRRGIANSNANLWQFAVGFDVYVVCGAARWYLHRDILEAQSSWFRDALPPPDPVRISIRTATGNLMKRRY
ncbi:hypothetical protein GE09DRAFT_168395 [Coniochaeta sp. 2T2.1]|nr:hypothetical protein GE09DRAFT_168395 [Coniochaeta sp. 2T2.1]